MELEAGTELTRENEPVSHLFHLAKGSADVTVLGKTVARVEGGFIGEIHVLAGDAASATVRTTTPTRVFCLSGENLRRLCDSDPRTRLYLEQVLSASTQEKLMRANQQLAGDPAGPV
jgi:CRP-like cAMP-binding protein